MKYDHKQVEKKWQDIWDEKQCFKAENGSDKEKFYALVEFPYPSGQGLHVGHPRSYTALDIVARKKRMQGYNVLYPMGWDAFGLPTENFAIKNHVHPAEVTKKNIARFKSQLKSLGLSFDWSREINTTDPSYYKWTQWIFLQLFKKGLAYKKEMSVNWCTSCKCVLANEEVVNGVCERCGSEVVHKTKSQWMLAITKYAQRLIDDLDDVNYIERVKIQQKNWIGRSTGAEVDFKTTEGDTLTVYTTRPDTLFGATYMVISPEHPMIEQWADKLNNIADVRAYREEAARKSDFERTELNKDKTGVKLEGVAAINPVNGKQIPIFVSDYVLMGYGTGAIMAVPAHDDRDWEFAKKFGCEIIEVVSGGEDVQKAAFTAKDETGILVNSDFLNGKTVKDAIPVMIEWLGEKGIGRAKVQYKLRDWVFSRQRYWGEPIPIVKCDKCGAFMVIRNGKFGKFLAGFFAVAITLALGFMGTMVQSNSISEACHNAFGIPGWAVGIFLCVAADILCLVLHILECSLCIVLQLHALCQTRYSQFAGLLCSYDLLADYHRSSTADSIPQFLILKAFQHSKDSFFILIFAAASHWSLPAFRI